MKTIEVKGFWGLLTFASLIVLAVIGLIAFPVTFFWVLWNAIVFETFNGPMLDWWQAIILTLAVAVAFKLVFQPQIGFHIKRVKSSDDLPKGH